MHSILYKYYNPKLPNPISITPTLSKNDIQTNRFIHGYFVLSRLGQGSFGEVYKVRKCSNLFPINVKVITKLAC